MRVSAILILSILLILGSCGTLPALNSETKPERVDFASVVAAFPEYRESGLPLAITPMTQQSINEETARIRTIAANSPKPEPVVDAPYLIGVRDILSVVVWDHPELTSPAGKDSNSDENGILVSEDGSIFYPYVGRVEVADLTVDQVRAKLTELLAVQIQSPQLDVRVSSYRSKNAFVVGEVARPGLQPITDNPLTLINAINSAGGLTDQADLSQATLSRKDETYTLNLNELFLRGDNSLNIKLIDGDVLTIPNTNDSNFYVLGRVKTPTVKRMNSRRKTLAEAIVDAGNVFPVVANQSVQYFVIRGTPDTPLVFHLDGEAADALILRNNFEVLARDIVYVVTARQSNWNRIYKQIIQYSKVYGFS